MMAKDILVISFGGGLNHSEKEFLMNLMSWSEEELLKRLIVNPQLAEINNKNELLLICAAKPNAEMIKGLIADAILVTPFSVIEKSYASLIRDNRKIRAIFDPTLNPDLFKSTMGSLLQLTVFFGLENWSDKFGEIIEQNLTELQRIKRIHEKIVPVREHKMKGAKILSKYSAGLLSGGDFFDVIQSQHDVLIILSSTHSYLVSSMAMGLSVHLRQKKSIEWSDLESYIKDLSSELKQKSLKFEKGDEWGMTLVKINLKDMSCKGYLLGYNELLSNQSLYKTGNGVLVDPLFADKGLIDIKLSRGEQLFFMSPGVRKNTSGLIKNEELIKYLRRIASQKTPEDVLNEIFFELKRDVSDDELLKYDSSVLFFEVDQNALFTL